MHHFSLKVLAGASALMFAVAAGAQSEGGNKDRSERSRGSSASAPATATGAASSAVDALTGGGKKNKDGTKAQSATAASISGALGALGGQGANKGNQAGSGQQQGSTTQATGALGAILGGGSGNNKNASGGQNAPQNNGSSLLGKLGGALPGNAPAGQQQNPGAPAPQGGIGRLLGGIAGPGQGQVNPGATATGGNHPLATAIGQQVTSQPGAAPGSLASKIGILTGTVPAATTATGTPTASTTASTTSGSTQGYAGAVGSMATRAMGGGATAATPAQNMASAQGGVLNLNEYVHLAPQGCVMNGGTSICIMQAVNKGNSGVQLQANRYGQLSEVQLVDSNSVLHQYSANYFLDGSGNRGQTAYLVPGASADFVTEYANVNPQTNSGALRYNNQAVGVAFFAADGSPLGGGAPAAAQGYGAQPQAAVQPAAQAKPGLFDRMNQGLQLYNAVQGGGQNQGQ